MLRKLQYSIRFVAHAAGRAEPGAYFFQNRASLP